MHEEVEKSGYYEREQRIEAVLEGLGFAHADIYRNAEEFSGGWQMRIALAKVLLESPDILLLDEPTNYLDLEARTWLEKWLQSFPGGCLLVSHDRYFLDVTVYELSLGALKRYAGNYSAYEKTRRAELDSLMKRYAEQQQEIAKTEALIRRFRYKATKASFAQELIKKLDKMTAPGTLVEIPENLKRMSIRFPDPPHAGKTAFTLAGLGKRYGERRVFSNLDLTLDTGEKLVVVGRNGAGKSTLLRILVGADADFEGEIRYGSGISAGYFSQDVAETLNFLDYMEAEAPTSLVPKIRDMLGAFLFRGDDVYKSVSVLSGGEKSRLALLKMLLKPMNLLILDEPTNHLDLQSKDILMETLQNYTGTVVFVSHDRGFMEGLSTKTLEMTLDSVKFFYGNYAYYIEKKEAEETGGTDRAAPTSARSAANDIKDAKKKREEDKKRQADERKRKRLEEEALAAIEALEAEKRRLEAELSLPDVYSNGEKARQVQALITARAAEIEKKTAEWEALAAEQSAVQSSIL